MKHLIIFTTIIFNFNSYSQLYFSSEYLGLLKTENEQLIPYRIFFTCDSYECTGFSISDEGGLNETKSTLVGKLSNDRQRIYFKETDIVYTKADYSTFDEFCYVTFEISSKSFFKEKSKKIETQYKAYFKDGQICSEGDLNLIISQELENRISKIRQEFIDNKKIKKIVGDSLLVIVNNKLDSIQKKYIQEKKTSTFTKKISSKNLIDVYLQDMGKIDGDKILIKGNKSSSIVELDKKLKNINIKSEKTIYVVGISEGKDPTIPLYLIIKNKLKTYKESIFLRESDTFKIELID